MLRVDMSQRVNRLLPDFAIWLDNACYSAGLLDAAAVRGRQDRYILHVTEVASASHRDILIDYREGDASFLPAANGLPARIAFGETDKNFAYALIAELMRPESMPAVADAASAALMRLAMRVAASDATAFIQGETGTGKEGIARFLHAMSPRAEKDFIAVNCAALPETMMEAMLFGHRKGSFTGAGHSAEGLFHAANGGTLFLDEITELPLPLQAKLLRALQEGEILPVGATHPVPVDIRVIAAGNRDVALEAEAGRFRTDLYWRLNVMPIKLQPLAERPDDIPAIAASFLLRHFKAMPQSGLAWPSAAAMTALSRHRWPGNARELGNVLQRALLLREGSRITPRDLALEGALDGMMGHAPIAQNDRGSAPASLHDIARNSKLDAIRAALLDTGGHRARTARLLGISERTLRYRLAEMRDLAMAG